MKYSLLVPLEVKIPEPASLPITWSLEQDEEGVVSLIADNTQIRMRVVSVSPKTGSLIVERLSQLEAKALSLNYNESGGIAFGNIFHYGLA